jgi:integrase
MAGNLDTKTVEAAAKRDMPYRLSDGGGLLLEVRPTGAKVWLCRLTVHGRRRDMGLGGFPTVSLKEARARALAARQLAERGEDPIAERGRLAREAEARRAAEAEATARTFKAVAEACIKAEAPGWKNKRTALLWASSLERHAYPVLGDLPIAEIDRAKVRKAIDGVWISAPSIGRKVLRRIATVLRYAAAHGWRANDNPADAKMLRHAGLPPLPGGKKQPSLPWARMPGFYATLRGMEGLAPLALRLVLLTALRSGEVRQARWSWLSFDGTPTLTIPGEVMKGKRSSDVQSHRVPLSPAAIEVLAAAYFYSAGQAASAVEMPRLAPLLGDALIFPSARRTTPLSDMALSAVMRRMNRAPKGAGETFITPWRDPDGREAVPHGFRATFSTWVDDTRPEEREAAERALAHEVANRVSAAYRRSDLFDRRVPLMRAWAEHCCREATVRDLASARRRTAG